MTILNKEELEKWEKSRDLLKELSKSVDEMISGIPCRTTEVEVSEKSITSERPLTNQFKDAIIKKMKGRT